MQINNLNKSNTINYSNFRKKTNSCANIDKIFEEIKVQEPKNTYSKNDNSNNSYITYSKNGLSVNQAGQSYPIKSYFDKGTAAHTIVYVNRNSYDKILNATTFGEPQWEEMGCDGEKRWVVVNGQRFECPLSKEEKELRKRFQQSIIDILDESDKKKNSGKSNGSFKPRGNIEALKNNEEVMDLLGRIFNANTFDEIFNKLS